MQEGGIPGEYVHKNLFEHSKRSISFLKGLDKTFILAWPLSYANDDGGGPWRVKKSSFYYFNVLNRDHLMAAEFQRQLIRRVLKASVRPNHNSRKLRISIFRETASEQREKRAEEAASGKEE